jgi:cytochrome c-type biogenesis protein
MSTQLTLWIALGSGFLSFLSPCSLPLFPSFLSYITGITVKDLQGGNGVERRQVLFHTLFFMLGFAIIFLAIGFSASLIGNLFFEYQRVIAKFGAILIVLMGFIMLGWINMKWIMGSVKFNLKNKPTGYTGSFLVGLTYAAGWTPCIGPILTAITTLSITKPNEAVLYMLLYIIGFSIPFFAMAFFMTKLKWVVSYSGIMMKVGGVILILSGLLLYFDKLSLLTNVPQLFKETTTIG